jgi:putative aldouronate transport system permease protein
VGVVTTRRHSPGRTTPPSTSTKPNDLTWRAKLRRDWPLLVMNLPMLLVVVAFWWVPALGNVIAFQDYNPYTDGILGSPIIGFTNFALLFQDPQFIRAITNTLSITAFQLVFYFPVPIMLALLLNSIVSARLRAFVQGVVYMPFFFSWVLVIAIFQQMFGGAGLLAQTSCCSPPRPSGRTPAGAPSSSWPPSAPSTPTCTRPPPWTAPAGGGACGTSRCPACAR